LPEAEDAPLIHITGRKTMKLPFLILGSALLLWSANSIAQQHQTCAGPQLGSWVLLSMETQDPQTNQKSNLLGVHPGGYLSYGSDCRMYVILVKESRAHPAELLATDPESVGLYRGMISYAGTYEVDGSKIIHHIQVSWNQAWTGTTQTQQFNVDGSTLFLRTGLSKNPLTEKESSTVFMWTRIE
jgi:Lipocalin-like domain